MLLLVYGNEQLLLFRCTSMNTTIDLDRYTRTMATTQADIHSASSVSPDDAATYAEWFACLSDPTRVRTLYAVATAPQGFVTDRRPRRAAEDQPVDLLAPRTRLADVGFVKLDKVGTSTVITVNQECCTGLPHAADVVMGTVEQRPCCPEDLPADIWSSARCAMPTGPTSHPHLRGRDRHPQRHVRDPGPRPAASWTGNGCRASAGSLPIDGAVVGWASISSGVSATRTMPDRRVLHLRRGRSSADRGVGKALIPGQVNAADQPGLWTLQTSVFPENRASIALHHSAGFRTASASAREMAQLDGVWRDTVFLERRSACC